MRKKDFFYTNIFFLENSFLWWRWSNSQTDVPQIEEELQVSLYIYICLWNCKSMLFPGTHYCGLFAPGFPKEPTGQADACCRAHDLQSNNRH